MNFFVLLCLFINASLIKRTLADNDPSLQVRAKDGSTYCFLLPNSPMTIGESEDGPGKTDSYCTKPTSDQQQHWPDNAWKNGGPNVAEKRDQWGNLLYRQITGCIDTSKFNTLLSNDGGGQYDSNGGQNHQGNPVGSSCYRFERFVQLVEPDVGRICLRCCNGEGHCDLSQDKDGCTKAIPGDYTGCE